MSNTKLPAPKLAADLLPHQIVYLVSEVSAALAAQAEAHAAALSSALCWPGGISTPDIDMQSLLHRVSSLHQERDALRAERDRWEQNEALQMRRAIQAEAERDALRAEVESLREWRSYAFLAHPNIDLDIAEASIDAAMRQT